jgi:hypothetical protein
MSWIAPTPEDVLSELTPAEATKYQNLLQGSSTTEKIVPILDRVVAEIRGYIRSGGYAVDEDDNTLLPPSLISDSVVITRWRFLTSVPDLQAVQSDARKAAFDAAMAKLMMIAKGDWFVEPPIPSTTSNQFGNWNSENRLIMRTHPVPSPDSQVGQPDTGYANS